MGRINVKMVTSMKPIYRIIAITTKYYSHSSEVGNKRNPKIHMETLL